MGQALLEVNDLYVTYSSGKSTVHALNGVSFSLEKGETLGLVGETGAGKTTTALSIMKLLPERTGRVRSGGISFNGLSLLDTDESQMRSIRGARISMIFQDAMTALNPLIPVGQQIEESLYLHKGNSDNSTDLEAQVDELLRLVGISPERKNEYPHQFSGGMKQRVVIAMALACSPQVLIADEPTTALDVTIQAQVLAMMADLKQRMDMSLLMITHDLGIVAKVCDKVAVMYAGEIVEYGTFEDFFIGELHHPYTNGLFRSIPDIYGDQKRLTPIEGMPPDPTALPSGCCFHPRCPNATEACRLKKPAVYSHNDHSVKCHLFAQEDGYSD